MTQFGGTSMNFDNKTKKLEIVNEKLSLPIKNCIIDNYKDRIPHLNRLTNFLKKQEPIELHKKIPGFSTGGLTKIAWNKAVEEGLVKECTVYIDSDIKFLEEHYNNKDVFYIQVGKAGFFYIKKNPMNFPIPRFTGELRLQIRPARSGSKYNEKYQTKVAHSSLRVQGRINTSIKSPFTLDDFKSSVELFRSIE